LGLLSVPPLSIAFTRALLNEQTFLSKTHIILSAAIGLQLAAAVCVAVYPGYVFAPVDLDLMRIAHAYAGAGLGLCYLALLIHLKKRAAGAERKRILYLAIAAAVPIVMIGIDLADVSGSGLSFHTHIVLAMLTYFILMIITHPQLTELHDLMARALVIFLMTFFAAVIFLVFTVLFGKSAVPFSHLLIASFLIIISIEPFKLVLKNILKRIYPEIPDVFTSLYALDEKLEREKSQLLEEMAHEIRNPLAGINLFIDILSDEEKFSRTPQEQDILNEVKINIKKIDGIIKRVLDFARQSETAASSRVKVSVLLDDSLKLWQSKMVRQGIQLKVLVEDGLADVLGDPIEIQQVLNNLIRNAVEAMETGGTLTVSVKNATLSFDRKRRAVITRVRDSGPGIPSEQQKRVFNPFFTTKHTGTGLGLAISHRIVSQHGGLIFLESAAGQGTTFTVELPAAID